MLHLVATQNVAAGERQHLQESLSWQEHLQRRELHVAMAFAAKQVWSGFERKQQDSCVYTSVSQERSNLLELHLCGSSALTGPLTPYAKEQDSPLSSALLSLIGNVYLGYWVQC